jgi:hypothetical protein
MLRGCSGPGWPAHHACECGQLTAGRKWGKQAQICRRCSPQREQRLAGGGLAARGSQAQRRAQAANGGAHRACSLDGCACRQALRVGAPVVASGLIAAAAAKGLALQRSVHAGQSAARQPSQLSLQLCAAFLSSPTLRFDGQLLLRSTQVRHGRSKHAQRVFRSVCFGG